ncbi:MAG TPA: hypothetical protein PLY09_10660 [Methanothrix sp.]|nr:hypothetical protein [Methanothrix sp.]
MTDGDDEVDVGQEDGNIVVKPLVDSTQFKKELRGCVGSSKIDSLEVKRIWKS